MRAGWSHCWQGELMLWAGFLSHWRRRGETVWPTSAVEKWLMVHQRLLQSGPWGIASVWCLSPGCGGANANGSLKDHGMVGVFCLFVFVCLFYFFPPEDQAASSGNGKFWFSRRWVLTSIFGTTLVKETISVSLGEQKVWKDVCPAGQCLHSSSQ